MRRPPAFKKGERLTAAKLNEWTEWFAGLNAERPGVTFEPRSIIVTLAESIGAEDFTEHTATHQVFSNASNTFTDGAEYKVRNISGETLTADGTRYIAKPVSNLGYCIERDPFTEAPDVTPSAHTCCGACLDSASPPAGYASVTIDVGVTGPSRLQVKPSNIVIGCCDDNYDGTQAVTLTWNTTDSKYYSPVRYCSEISEWSRWEFDAKTTRVLSFKTGATPPTYGTTRAKFDVKHTWESAWCPTEMETDRATTDPHDKDCHFCPPDEVCISPLYALSISPACLATTNTEHTDIPQDVRLKLVSYYDENGDPTSLRPWCGLWQPPATGVVLGWQDFGAAVCAYSFDETITAQVHRWALVRYCDSFGTGNDGWILKLCDTTPVTCPCEVLRTQDFTCAGGTSSPTNFFIADDAYDPFGVMTWTYTAPNGSSAVYTTEPA